MFFCGRLPDQVHIGSYRAVVVFLDLSAVEDDTVKSDEEDPAARDEQGGAGVVLLIIEVVSVIN